MPFTLIHATTAKAAPVITLGAPLTSTGYTLSQYQDRLQATLGGRFDVDPSDTQTWTNEGYRHLYGMLKLKQSYGDFQITLDASQPLYLLPSNIEWVRHVSVIDTVDYSLSGGVELEKIDLDKYRKLDEVTDEPSAWFRQSSPSMLVIWPTPKVSRVITVDARYGPQDLVNGTDSPILPYNLHEAIYLAALYRAFRDLGQKDSRDDAMNDMLVILRPLLNPDAEEAASSKRSRVTPVRSLQEFYRRTR